MFLDCAIFFSITRDSGTRSKTRWKGIGHHLIFSSYDYECLFPSDKFPIKREKRHDAHGVCPRFRNKSIAATLNYYNAHGVSAILRLYIQVDIYRIRSWEERIDIPEDEDPGSRSRPELRSNNYAPILRQV